VATVIAWSCGCQSKPKDDTCKGSRMRRDGLYSPFLIPVLVVSPKFVATQVILKSAI